MRKIVLTDGAEALVSDSDYESLSAYKWRSRKIAHHTYAYRSYGKGKIVYMHRQIMNPERGNDIDHHDGDGLNNQRSNLRICTRANNCMNRKRNVNKVSSVYKGVSKQTRGNTWKAYIAFRNEIGKMRIIQNGFTTEEAAARWYDEMAKKHFGQYAYLNFPS